MSKKSEREEERQRDIATLRASLPPGSTVYTILRHRSRSGMYRRISLMVVEGGETRCIDGLAASVLGYKLRSGQEGIPVGGCGMDMGFHLVYNLSYELYPDGFGCIGKSDDPWVHCPASDHSNGDRDYTPHADAIVAQVRHERVTAGALGKRSTVKKEDVPGHWHESGGYALRHQWL